MSSVVLEVSVPAESFELGRILSPPEGVHVELERLVPLGVDDALTFWAVGCARDRLAERVRSDPRVASVSTEAERDERTLYRLEWATRPGQLLGAVRDAGGAVLRARLDGEWLFRLRFPGHDRLSQFHDRCRERDVPLRIERINPDHEASGPDDRYGLSDAQREALVLALERGYFATPSEVSLQELADDLDISHQALSSRIRRGLACVLPEVLFTTERERDAAAVHAEE